jgi:RNA methyltransferase, TrmH family
MKAITSHENPLFRQLKKLAESSRERRKSGHTLLDGPHLLEALLASGGKPERVCIRGGAAAKPELAGLLRGIEEHLLVELAPALFDEVSPVENPSGLLALVAIPQRKLPPKPEFCVLLEGLQDPGNLGTILRSAAAAGVEVAWLSTGCADAWSPKVLRAAMGAHFVLAIEERADLVARTSAFGGLTVATSLATTRSLYDLDLTGPVAFMFGNEGAGLSEELLELASERVRIPMPGKVESLNAAAAASICLFERVRQRR